MDPPVFFEVRGGRTQANSQASNSSVQTEQETGETEIKYRNHRWENTGNHNRGRKLHKITETKQWRRYVLGNLEFFMHFLPVTVSNKLFAANQSFLTLLWTPTYLIKAKFYET